jgi:hypothetical protein
MATTRLARAADTAAAALVAATWAALLFAPVRLLPFASDALLYTDPNFVASLPELPLSA